MAQRGRPLAYPNGSQVVTVRLPSELYRALHRLSEEEGRTFNRVIIDLCGEAVEARGHAKPVRITRRRASQVRPDEAGARSFDAAKVDEAMARHSPPAAPLSGAR